MTSNSTTTKLRDTLSKAPANSAYARHIQKCLQYVDYYGGSVPTALKGKTERDLLEEEFEFLRDDIGSDGSDKDAGKEIAKKYYENLFREFALIDLSRWRDGQVALRWRTKQEVLQGIGQFTCASLTCPRHSRPEEKEERDEIDAFILDAIPGDKNEDDAELETFEMNFGYVEKGVKKNALVKVCVCTRCARKLRKVKNPTKERKDKERDKNRHSSSKYRSRSRSRSKDRDRHRRRDRETSRDRRHRLKDEEERDRSTSGRDTSDRTFRAKESRREDYHRSHRDRDDRRERSKDRESRRRKRSRSPKADPG
ncbi:hypothetical protein ABW19_dt0207309 [Dactylella cylindrospora]|nr:hypothetical protein ABW19_dt0207309 [Dactylella cylindrospora]